MRLSLPSSTELVTLAAGKVANSDALNKGVTERCSTCWRERQPLFKELPLMAQTVPILPDSMMIDGAHVK